MPEARSLVTQGYQYRGDLGERALPEMLYTIYQHGVSGVVQAIQEDVVKRVYLRHGAIVYATSSNIKESLGPYLLKRGLITLEDFKVTMRQRRNTELRLGSLLIERGSLSPAQLYEAIRLQVEEIVWNLFAWDQGKVTFSIGDANEPVGTSIQIPVRRAIKEGVKHHPRPLELIGRIGPDTVLEADYTIDDLIEVALERGEYELLKLVDGEKTLRQLCAGGPLPTADNGKLLYAFHVLRFVRPAKQSDVAAGGSGALKIRLKGAGDRFAE